MKIDEDRDKDRDDDQPDSTSFISRSSLAEPFYLTTFTFAVVDQGQPVLDQGQP